KTISLSARCRASRYKRHRCPTSRSLCPNMNPEEVLVPLHRGLDGLLVVSSQGRERVGVDEHFDTAGDARLSSDEPAALEREDHLVDGRRADMAGGRPTT